MNHSNRTLNSRVWRVKRFVPQSRSRLQSSIRFTVSINFARRKEPVTPPWNQSDLRELSSPLKPRKQPVRKILDREELQAVDFLQSEGSWSEQTLSNSQPVRLISHFRVRAQGIERNAFLEFKPGHELQVGERLKQREKPEAHCRMLCYTGSELFL